MNDVKDLLGRALNDGPGPDSGPTVDPAADLARGRARLHRRRTAVLSGATAALPATGPATGSATAPKQATTAGGPELKSIGLVSYTGTQPKGYKVSWVPKGWVIQGVDRTALVIAPKGAKDKNPHSFRGKLAVLSASVDEPHTLGKRISVGGRPGYLRTQDDIQMLSYKSSTGRWVDIQAPLKLGWSSTDIAKFAAGIKVLKDAADTHG
jgi:hypothetical protein